MTEPDWSGGATAAKPALSKRAIRTWAWTAGAISFLSPWALLGLSPKPASATPVAPAPPQQPKVIIHVIRRVIYTAAPASTSS